MSEWFPVFPFVIGLFGVLAGIAAGIAAVDRKQNVFAIAICSVSLGLVAFGVIMFQFTTVTREECAVVGTSAEDATYVCVEVTE